MITAHFSGSPYSVGVQAGQRFAREIHLILDTHSELHTQILPYHQTSAGHDAFHRFMRIHERECSDQLQELRGMAIGAGCSFANLLMLNLRGEYVPHVPEFSDTGCSTCCVNTTNFSAIGHNEDAMNVFQSMIYLARVSIPERPEFIALSYPGFLFGNSMVWNDAGIFFTVNIMALKRPRPGIGRNFIARRMAGSTSLEAAVQCAGHPSQSSGFNYVIASASQQRMMDVEVACEKTAVREITGDYFHTNHYTELMGIEHLITQSSRSRLQRGRELLEITNPSGEEDIRKILGDTESTPWPICRHSETDTGTSTIVSLIYNLRLNRLSVCSPGGIALQVMNEDALSS